MGTLEAWASILAACQIGEKEQRKHNVSCRLFCQFPCLSGAFLLWFIKNFSDMAVV